ncbi:OLC1v1027508C1 [Oldenlandia corymbosa var. corymbosa]|uniref:DNA-directed primase/polymerase protein n=1 Tax=Oldenlandia corymbosa var. corymbosa TaxID=529605 RepID=A0AAV1CCP0_OLDCO|nr:OLC1v1027508C1 [Oldenlandia corymbosa var. corymbosa]
MMVELGIAESIDYTKFTWEMSILGQLSTIIQAQLLSAKRSASRWLIPSRISKHVLSANSSGGWSSAFGGEEDSRRIKPPDDGIMDDVDRLFECFKCGVTPPESAFRHRKRGKYATSRRDDSVPEASTCRGNPSPNLTPTNQRGSRFNTPLSAHNSPRASTILSSSENKKKQFSPIVFYGSPQGVPPKRPARLLRLLREIRVDISEQNKLREEIWVTFPRQDEAMKYLKSHANGRVFCYQDHVTGQRRFLVSTYKEFWQRYMQMNPKFRHHYEVIQEGLPCHLYFDLEFDKKINLHKNGDEMVDLLISVVFDVLHEKYGIEGNLDCIVELDSSNEEKFSRHVIARLPKIAFKDNSHVGAFVLEICSRINKSREKDGRYENLYILKDSGLSESQCQLFVDTAVYSRNRCFRLPLSSKAGKSSVLLPSGRFKCKGMNEEEVFMASLICNMDSDCEKFLICKMDLDCVKALHFDSETTNASYKPSGYARQFDLDSCTTDASRTYLMGQSPFPPLDAFIEFVASSGNVKGKIRSWYWFSEYGLMVYSMLRNRYCERIGREHKSNHVMYVVDIRRGDYYQKCYDPDCRGYRSPLRPLPEDVIPDPTNFQNSEGPTEIHVETMSPADGTMTDSCKKEWWSEAVRLADEAENVQKKLDLTGMADDWEEDDDDWWTAVERAASQTESMYTRHA